MRNKKTFIILSILLLISANNIFSFGNKEINEENTIIAQYNKISAQDAKAIFDKEPNSIILDVRTEEEFNAARIPNSINIPLNVIENEVSKSYPDKNTKLYLYCRSGNRSNQAANLLVNLGYTQVYDFGGIINWPYEIIEQ